MTAGDADEAMRSDARRRIRQATGVCSKGALSTAPILMRN
jgi:hypothetical protein